MRQVHGGGDPARLGAHPVEDGVSFAVHSETAETIWVCLFDTEGREAARVPLDGRAGPVHFGAVAGIGAGQHYGLRADGPYAPERALWFDPQKLLVDPYARRLDRPLRLDPALSAARGAGGDTASLVPKAIIEAEASPLAPAARDRAPALIYELNVRGFTRLHPEVPELLQGTLAGLAEPKVIEHLVRLGVDVVELMPVAAFIDDLHLPRLGLTNAWGYNPIAYFAPDPRLAPGGMADLRALTDTYGQAGIGVVLDVVYNHTGESDAGGPVVSMKGLDGPGYYRLVEDGEVRRLVNDAGTGNVLATEKPAVRRLVIESLRHWIEQGGVAGFRFDLAPLLGRTPEFDAEAPLLAEMRADPVVGKSLLIAEPWDPGPGGYRLGQFGPPFLEWNDRYRDDVRRFWRREHHMLGALATRLAGSADVFGGRAGPACGVNFLAAHDGFTLRDLVSYSERHNLANGEDNRDGHAHNLSWNWGEEGESDDPEILAARGRDVRALLATLMMSRGTPMIQQGDEMGRTQAGNNNAYAQDNEITWVDWVGADRELAEFVARLAAFRAAHRALTADRFLTGTEDAEGRRDAVWWHNEGREMQDDDWALAYAWAVGLQLNEGEDTVLVWVNRSFGTQGVVLPAGDWELGFASAEAPEIIASWMNVPERSVVALVRR